MAGVEGQGIERILMLAEVSGVTIPPEHLAEVALAWELMAPHRRRVADVELDAGEEPAALFRP